MREDDAGTLARLAVSRMRCATSRISSSHISAIVATPRGIAVQRAGVMAATIPAALLMARIGRRPGFWLGTAIGGVGAVIATGAIFRGSFEWFCFGTFLLGANRGATQQYRFAAAEIADEAF